MRRKTCPFFLHFIEEVSSMLVAPDENRLTRVGAKVLRALLIFCLASAPSAAQAMQKKASQPDVFLVTIDTLRADHVHCYGYKDVQTPALDGLARDGIRFGQAFTPSPITNTSHASILTGLLPSNHGVTDFAAPLSAVHPTWAELLHQRAYHTAAFIGAVILDSETLAPGLDRGFDFYDNFPEHSRVKSRWGRVERRGMDVVQRAEAWLSAHPTGPHFVWVHLYDPHDPYEPPAPYSQIYKDHLYDGEIAYADSALANFITYLKRHRWYENSLIVVVGDHGEGLGENYEATHGSVLLPRSMTTFDLALAIRKKLSPGVSIVRTIFSIQCKEQSAYGWVATSHSSVRISHLHSLTEKPRDSHATNNLGKTSSWAGHHSSPGSNHLEDDARTEDLY